MKRLLLLSSLCVASLSAQFAPPQRTKHVTASDSIQLNCSSAEAAYTGGWKHAATAPHDGTVVELMITYGTAPWYGIFKWTREMESKDEKDPSAKPYPYTMPKPEWVSVNQIGHFVDENNCLYWRPYKGTGKYVDPTNGAQNTVKYWCDYMHLKFDKKSNTCRQ